MGPDKHLRGPQLPALQEILRGQKDVVVASATGIGKSLIFLLAAKIMEYKRVMKTIVLVEPTNALMNDQQAAALKANLNSKVLSQYTNDDEREEIRSLIKDGTLQLCTLNVLFLI